MKKYAWLSLICASSIGMSMIHMEPAAAKAGVRSISSSQIAVKPAPVAVKDTKVNTNHSNRIEMVKVTKPVVVRPGKARVKQKPSQKQKNKRPEVVLKGK